MSNFFDSEGNFFPSAGGGAVAADVTMALVEEYRWDVTAETAVDFVATTATTHVSSETGLTNAVVSYAGASVFRVGTSGLEVTKSGGSPYYIVDVGDHIDLGGAHAFYPMEWIVVLTRVDYTLPTNGDTVTVASINGISGDGVQAQIQNIGGVVKIFPQRFEPSSSGSGSAVTLNGGATTGTVWIWHEIAGATHRIAYKATEPTSWGDGTNLFTPEMISEADAGITTTDLDDGYRYYVQITGASGAGFVIPTWAFSRWRAVDATTLTEVGVTVNGVAVTATYAPAETAALTVVDSQGAAIGTLNVGTGAVTVDGKWVQSFSHDFTAEASLDYNPATSPITLLGASWTQAGATYADDVDTVNATGLVVDMSASNSTFETSSQTHWHITLPLSNAILFGTDYDKDKTIAVLARLSGLGDAATELHGIFIGNDLGATDHAGAVGLGFAGAAAGLIKYRQGGITSTPSAAVATGATDCVMLVRRSGSWSAYYGTSSGGAMATSWTQAGGSWSANLATSAADGFTTATDLLGLWASTGNTSNNFAPVFCEIAGYIVDSEVPA